MCPKDHLSQQLQRSQLPTIWTIPDPMWDQLKELLPKEKEPGTPGRPPVPFRSVMDGILFVLRTGCHWNAVPSTFGSGSTCHRRFQQWIDAGMLEALVERMLRLYDELCSIDWRWQAADAKTLPAPLGGGQTGPNPTDLGKSGTKRHLLIDGRGVPLSVHLSAANCHDLKSLADLIGAGKLLAKERKKPTGDEPQHLCLDKAYDAKEADALLDELGYTGHIKRQGESEDASESGVGEPVYPARRWKVERSIAWMNNMRKLRTRWEKKAENYRGLWLLAIALIIYRRIILG
jgi:putative transposase